MTSICPTKSSQTDKRLLLSEDCVETNKQNRNFSARTYIQFVHAQTIN